MSKNDTVKESVKILLVISQNASWTKMIKSLFPVHKIETLISINKQNALELVKSNSLTSILIDDSLMSDDIATVANAVMLNSPKAKFYLHASDISLVDGLKNKTQMNIHTFLAPINPAEMQRTIIAELFPRKKKQVMYNVDLNLMKTFITCTNEVMEEMAGIQEMMNLSPFILGDANKKVEPVKIRGALAINCQQFKGTFFISFPEQTFLNIYENMLDEKVEALNDEIRDMGAEFANIIYGKVKRVLNSEDYDLGMVIPSVEVDLKIESEFDVIVIPMFTELGNFYIKVAPNYLR